MIDTVELHIPVLDVFCTKQGTLCQTLIDVTEFGLVGSSRYVKKTDNGIIPYEIYHAYESLPTSHSGIGFKLMHKTNNCLPHVILNCSIAKILQGHNVFGVCNLLTGVFEMMGVFKKAYPECAAFLDFQNTTLSRIDITLPIQTKSRHTAERVRDYIRNVDFGRYRNLAIKGKKDNYNTIYFGSEKSRVGGFKLYCKGVELDNVLSDLSKKASKGCLASASKLKNIYTKQVIDYANTSIRLETTIKKRQFEQLNLPTNLWTFLKHQHQHPTVYEDLFKLKTDEFMQALQGLTMKNMSDTDIYELLLAKLSVTTPTGKVSTTRAKHAYSFYLLLKSQGFYNVKKISAKTTFNRNLKSLIEAGIARSHLQNLTKDDKTPILDILQIDLNAKNPDGYIPNTGFTDYYHDFIHYFEAA